MQKNLNWEKFLKTISFSLKKAVKDVFKELVLMRGGNATVLFSPASASYDQFNNFAERGNQFKKITKDYAKKFL